MIVVFSVLMAQLSAHPNNKVVIAVRKKHNKAFEFAPLVSLASRDAQKASLFGAPQLKR